MASKSAPSALERHLGYWLRRVSNAVSGRFSHAVQAESVSVAEWVALRLLHDEERRTPGDLAGLTGMTRGAISKIVEKLEGKDLVARTANPDDARVQWLSLTRSGQFSVARLAAIADRNDEEFFGRLTTSEQKELRRLLEKLCDLHGLNETPVD